MSDGIHFSSSVRRRSVHYSVVVDGEAHCGGSDAFRKVLNVPKRSHWGENETYKQCDARFEQNILSRHAGGFRNCHSNSFLCSKNDIALFKIKSLTKIRLNFI